MAERMSDAAIKAKTGRTWPEWFDLLEAEGARSMTHQQIVAVVRDKFGIGPWWQQSVAVAFEQALGRRDKHQAPDGYQISVSRTFPVPAPALFQAWEDEGNRRAWLLDGSLAVRKATPTRSIRASWGEGGTRLDIAFYPRGGTKTQVTVQHRRLPASDEAERMKTYWAAALDRLAAHLNS